MVTAVSLASVVICIGEPPFGLLPHLLFSLTQPPFRFLLTLRLLLQPAPPTRFQVFHTSTLAALVPGSIRSWPVGMEAAEGGRNQQLFC